MLRPPLRRRGPIYIYILLKRAPAAETLARSFKTFLLSVCVWVRRLYFSARKTYKLNICAPDIDFGKGILQYDGTILLKTSLSSRSRTEWDKKIFILPPPSAV